LVVRYSKAWVRDVADRIGIVGEGIAIP